MGALTVVAAAGCIDNDQPPADALAVVSGGECLGAAAGKCDVVDGVLYVRGVALESSTDEGIGLLVRNLEGPVVVERLDVRGVGHGVQVQHTCASCRVEFRNAWIESAWQGIVLADKSVQGQIVVRDTTITALRAGMKLPDGRVPGEEAGPLSEGGNVTVGFDTIGIMTQNYTGNLLLDGLRIVSPVESSGRAVWAFGPAGALDARDVTIEGFGRAFTGAWTNIRFRDVEVACVYDALFADRLPNVDVDGLRVSGCQQNIPGCIPERCEAAISLIGNLFETGGHAWFRNVEFQDNQVSLLLGDYTDFILEDFRIENGTTGVTTSMVDEIVLRNGTIADQNRAGAILAGDRMSVTGVEFLRNGLSPKEAYESHVGLEVRADTVDGYYPGPRTIRQSSFVGNVPFGLDGNMDPWLDASENWWGSPLGPSQTYSAPGFGDVVVEAFVTEPHLTSPP